MTRTLKSYGRSELLGILAKAVSRDTLARICCDMVGCEDDETLDVREADAASMIFDSLMQHGFTLYSDFNPVVEGTTSQDGTSGQDRESYSDNQDRENYHV